MTIVVAEEMGALEAAMAAAKYLTRCSISLQPQKARLPLDSLRVASAAH